MPVESMPDVSGLVVGLIGGTGPQGRGLARRWAAAGQQVLIGSRDAERARSAAGELGVGGGADNATVAAQADLLVLAVPWEGHRETVERLAGDVAGKVVVDCVNPLGFDRRGPFAVAVPEGSAAEQAQVLLPDSLVVGAFHHVSAVLLTDPTVSAVDCDVLVVGDDRAATDTVLALAERIPGMHGVYAGRLRTCRTVEALTANLLAVNRRYGTHAGIRVTGL